MSVFLRDQTKTYKVHRHIINQVPCFAEVLESHPSIWLSRVDEDIGHTMVHYLYTSQYQTIDDDPSLSETKKRQREYKRSVFTYYAAVSYGIADLSTLAQRYIRAFEDSVDIFQILAIARKIYAYIKAQSTWYPEYIKEKLCAAFETDETIFQRGEFSKCYEGGSEFDKLILEIMISSYSSRISKLKQDNRIAWDSVEDLSTELSFRQFTTTCENCTGQNRAEEQSITESFSDVSSKNTEGSTPESERTETPFSSSHETKTEPSEHGDDVDSGADSEYTESQSFLDDDSCRGSLCNAYQTSGERDFSSIACNFISRRPHKFNAQ